MKLSIIIPIYNVGRFLAPCLDSLEAQSLEDWEAICVDDGSTDGSGTVLDLYAKEDPRFKVIHKANGGVASARNTGLVAARGEWIALLDADDFVSPDLYRNALTNVDESIDIVCCAVKNVNEDGRASVAQRRPFRFARMTGDALLGFKGGEYGAYQTSGWDKIYRRSFIQSHALRFLEEFNLGEDILFTLMALSYANCVEVRPQAAYYHYRDRVGSATDNITVEREMQTIKRYRLLYEFWKKHGGDGLAACLSGKLLGIMFTFLGDRERDGKWANILARDKWFNDVAIHFIKRHSSRKAGCFVALYSLMPVPIKEMLLEILQFTRRRCA